MEFSVTSTGKIQVLMDPSLLDQLIKAIRIGLVDNRRIEIETSDSEEKPDFYKIDKRGIKLYELIKRDYGINVWIYSDDKKLGHLNVEAETVSVDASFKTLIARGKVIEAQYHPDKNKILRFKLLK
jgi:6-phosphogluconolactonase (cycloisomerase 2 family)